MFLKKDRKILMFSAAGLVIFAAAGFLIFDYSEQAKTTAENSSNMEAEEQYDEDFLPRQDAVEQAENSGEQNANLPEIKIEAIQGTGLSICQDKCGDGVCQAEESECDKGMNCICKETKEECPADCK
ncbi:MAG: hypothetical protein HYT36_01635 [Candidatus Staskawiczbacteria bacterium]|nr:hypothetical protein [Candidatus Staskawiczbacteria bacterium]